MNIKNYEFKAKITKIETYENKLLTLNPFFQGVDHQIDTYFDVKKGRLKLREGNIENSLIYYERANISGSKESQIILYKHDPNTALKDILLKHIEIKAVVDKIRRIYFINNVKFHFDRVKYLGSFLEVEAIDSTGEISLNELKQQCDKFFNFFQLSKTDLIDLSYGELIKDNKI